MDGTEVLRCDEHDRTSGNLTHASDDRHSSHLVFNKLPGQGSYPLLEKGIDELLFEVTNLQRTDQNLIWLEVFHFS